VPGFYTNPGNASANGFADILCEEDRRMGLAERRVTHEFQTKELPVLEGQVEEAAGFKVPVEVNWDALTPEGESRLYAESWRKVYFEPLIAALKAIGGDEMGREALKKGLHRVVIGNTSGNYYPDHWARLEGGTLTLDHDPITNIGDVQPRMAQLIAVLESGL
jgi:hypothetical protein